MIPIEIIFRKRFCLNLPPFLQNITKDGKTMQNNDKDVDFHPFAYIKNNAYLCSRIKDNVPFGGSHGRRINPRTWALRYREPQVISPLLPSTFCKI